MKKILAIFSISSPIDKIKARYYQKKGYEIYSWENIDSSFQAKKIPFPPSSSYCTIAYQGRDKVREYFDKHLQSHSPDLFLLDYARKQYAWSFADYNAFKKSIEINFSNDQVKIIGPKLLADIFDDKSPRFNILKIFPLLLFALAGSRRILFGLIHSLKSEKKFHVPDIMFLRKKVYPDLSIGSTLTHLLREKGLKAEMVFFFFSSLTEKYEFKFLNAFHGIVGAAFKGAIQGGLQFLRDFYFFYRSNLPSRTISSYVFYSFVAKTLVNLGPKAFLGILVDKPIYILLARYKNSEQKLYSLNECFYYPPFRGFDYCHLDTYYSMNSLDASIQNVCGGEIKEFKHVEFFRKDLKTNSKGISDELQKLLDKFEFSAMAAPIQVPNDKYQQWAPSDLVNFLSKILELAQKKTDTLFIIKGKKGELDVMPPQFFEECDRLENMFVIHSKVPRELIYNQFEDLIKEVDLLISMAHTSTTVWQAMAHDVPAIAINDVHTPSFLSEFQNVEVSLNGLEQAFDFWRESDKNDWPKFRDLISNKVNLGEGRGLEVIAQDLAERYIENRLH
jgi:hypothetical protein